MNKFLLLTIIALLCCLSSKAQWFKTYESGYYYDLAGNKVKGLISFLPYEDKIYYKTDKEAGSQKIKIAEIKSLVIMRLEADSLTVMSENGKANNLYLAKYMMATPTMRFYYRCKNGSTGGGTSASNGYRAPAPITYFTGNVIMYSDGNTTHELTRHNYKEVLTKVMADDPASIQKLNSKDFKFDQVEHLLADYNMKDHSGNQ